MPFRPHARNNLNGFLNYTAGDAPTKNLRILFFILPLIFVFFTLVKPASAFARDYYVDCNAANDNGDGTSGTPYKTLKRFTGRGADGTQVNLSAGENLYLNRGCNFTGYNIKADWTGTSESPITIGAYGTGAQPILWLDYPDTSTAIEVIGTYITIENLKLTADQSTLPHGTEAEGGFTLCPDMAFGYFYGVKVGTTSHHITIQNSTITQFSRGINVQVNEADASVTPHHLTIIYNDISENTAAANDIVPQQSLNGAKAIDIKGNDNIVAYNFMKDNKANCPPESGMIESNAIEVYDAKRNVIHHNVSIGNRVFSEIGGKTDDLDFNSEDIVFAYNVVSTDQDKARFIVIHGKNITFGPTLGVRLYNNTYYSSSTNDSQGISCSGCDTDVLIMRNNIIWARTKAIYVGTGQTPIETNNIFWDGDGSPFPSQFTQNYTIDGTSQKVDPLFVDAANGNFRLQSGSPAIDIGSNDSEMLAYSFMNEDSDGTSIPQNTTMDIGSFENVVSSVPFNGTTYVADTFTRTAASGWGTTETGSQTWTTAQSGSGGSHSINGTQGLSVHGSCNTTNQERLDGLDVLNSDMTFKVKSNKAPITNETQTIYVVSRKQASLTNWEYRHRLQFSGTSLKLLAGKLLGSTSLTTISADTTVSRETFTADTFYKLRVQTYGTSPTTIRMKVWQDGTTEPTSWDLTTTDSESNLQNSGASGIRSFISSTCSAPITLTYDDVSIKSMSTPAISLTAQYQTNCTSALNIGGFVNGTAMCIGSTVNDADNPDTLTLQAEVQPTTTAFTGTANFSSVPVATSGSEANPTISVTGLTVGLNYHWQARVVDSLGNTSAWVPFGGNTETSTDFATAAIPSIQFTSTAASGDEATTSVSLPISISTATSQNVSVNYAVTGGTASGSGTDYTLASGTATVTAGNTTTTIPVTIVNDQIDEDDETIIVTLSSPTNGTLGSNVIYTYTITDNDTAGRSITPSTSINATEGGATATYTIRLNTQPTSDVTVSISGDSQVQVSPTSLTFTSSDWNSNKQITATAIDDLTAEGAHNGIITHTATSSDAKYNGLSFPTKTVKITDNDSAGVSVSESSGSTNVTEGGATDSYTIALSTLPTSDVTITVSPDSQVSVDNPTLTFTTSNWSTPQTVTITGVNDSIVEGTHSGTINHTAASSDGNYNNISIGSITATVTDNDTAGITVTQSSGTTAVTEGGSTDSYTVVLTSQPTNDVTVAIDHDSEVSLDKSTLTFTNSDWSSAQTVTVTAVNDDIDEDSEDSIITHTATSSDSNYNAISVDSVTTAVTDNDTADINISESGGGTDVTEGGTTDTFTIVLASEPTSSVSVDLSSLQVTALNQDPLTPDEENPIVPDILFTASNWDTPQTIVVTAIDDEVQEGSHTGDISFEITSSDTKYSVLNISDIIVDITDNDTAGITVTQSGGTTAVTEGGATDTYTIVLDSQPSADVTVDLSTTSRLQLSASSLTFTTSNWDTPQTVTVIATNDSNYIGNGSVDITHTATSSDDNYDGISISTVSVSITEDETPGITITQSGGSTNVTEGGATDSYTIVLDNQPSADVTVNIAGTGGQVSLSAPSVTFTDLNWDTPQTVTITALNDSIAEGAHQATLTHTSTSSDGAFNGLTIGQVIVNISDNDTAAISISQSSGSTEVAEAGETSDSYTVVLTSQPTSDVTVNITGNDSVDLDKTSLSFTTGNWDTPQTVTVTANNDSVATGNYSNVLTHTSSSSDTNYSGKTSNVTVLVTDDDTSGITVTETGGDTAISESGTTDTFTVVLDTQPSSDVTISMATSEATAYKQGTSSSTLTFTNSNWNVAQTVTVTATDDNVAEGSHSRTVSFAVSSSDLSYNDFDIPGVDFTVTDNDTAGVTLSQSSGSTTVNEDGTTDTYTVVLNTQPTNTVIINPDPDSGVTVNPTSLTFTISNWNTPQTITVSAVDNLIIDGTRSKNIDHEALSTDNFYDGISINSITVSVEDNEVPGVTLSQSDGSTSVNEHGGTDIYTISLNTIPAANVTINIATTSDEITISESELTFTASDWNVPQSITVTGIDDDDFQGNRTATITHSSESDDSDFDDLDISNVVVTITDDEREENVEIQVTETGGDTVVEEGGDTDTIEVELSDQPSEKVKIKLSADDDGKYIDIDDSTLEIEPDDWEKSKKVKIKAIDNNTVDGDHKVKIKYEVDSEDGRYDDIDVNDTEIYVKDNDIKVKNEADIPGDGITPYIPRSGETNTPVTEPSEPVLEMTEIKTKDITGDNKFDMKDLQVIMDNWLKNISGRSDGDLNADGIIDLSDLSILARNWEE